MWRLRLGLLEFARRGVGTGHQLEILVGHFTSRALLRRELLSVFGTAYTFIARHRHTSVVLWLSVIRELTWGAHLIHLSQRSLAAAWSTTAHCFDASWWGLGLVKKCVPLDVVRDTARRCERWRFTRGQEDPCRAGSKEKTPASRYKKKDQADSKIRKSLDRNSLASKCLAMLHVSQGGEHIQNTTLPQ